MLKFLAEYIGTFLFLSVILNTGKAIPIALALAASIYFGGSISGGHFNPAVTLMMTLKGNLNGDELVKYWIAQVLGACSALYFYKWGKKLGIKHN